MLVANHVGYTVGSARLLHNVSLVLHPGEVVAVIGPNGAGKSTLLKLLGGELQPGSGSLRMDGRCLASWGRQACARKRAVMPQTSQVAFPFTVAEMVMMGRSPHVAGRESAMDQRIVAATMAWTGIDRLAARNFNTLSGGEQQRVQLARALAQIGVDPVQPSGTADAAHYLLLDEPVASMDPAHQHQTLRIARQCSQRSVGVLVVLHDINLAAMYADRIAVFNQGELVSCGEVASTLSEQLLYQVFGIRVSLQRHPTMACPLVVPLPDSDAIPNIVSRPDAQGGKGLASIQQPRSTTGER